MAHHLALSDEDTVACLDAQDAAQKQQVPRVGGQHAAEVQGIAETGVELFPQNRKQVDWGGSMACITCTQEGPANVEEEGEEWFRGAVAKLEKFEYAEQVGEIFLPPDGDLQ